MPLIILFAVLFCVGEAVAFALGVVAEKQFGAFVGLIVFFGGFVVSIGIAWQAAVRLTAPKLSMA